MVEQNGTRGIALILVIVVLASLLLLATPFSISMKDQYSSATGFRARAEAVEDVKNVRTHAIATLYGTHATGDDTPYADGPADLKVPLDFATANLDVADPKGRIWSVRVEDEQGKVNVNACSPHLLSNLFATTELSDAVAEDDDVLPVVDASRFDPAGGCVVVDGEMIVYSKVTSNGLQVQKRGYLGQDEWYFNLDVNGAWSFNVGSIIRVRDAEKVQYGIMPTPGRGTVRLAVAYSPPIEHRKGSAVLDGRAHAVVMYRLLREPGKLHSYPAPLAIRAITEMGLPPFKPEELERVQDLLTVYGRHQGATLWSNTREVRGDADLPAGLFHGGQTVVEVLTRTPININTAPRRVKEAVFSFVKGSGRGGQPQDPALPGKLADRIEKWIADNGPIAGIKDLVENILRPAREADEINEAFYAAFLEDAANSHSQILSFPTASLIFRTLDVYTLETAAAVNNAAGLSLAVDRKREVISVNPQRLLGFALNSQRDFEDHMLAGNSARLTVTGPVNVETIFGPMDPPMMDPPTRLVKYRQGIYPSEDLKDETGVDQGDVRLRPARTAMAMRGSPMFNYRHFDESQYTEGLLLDKESRTVPLFGGGGDFVRMQAQDARQRQVVVERRVQIGGRPGAPGTPVPQVPGGGGQVSGLQRLAPGVISLWYKPLGSGGQRSYIFGTGTGEAEFVNKIECYYDGQRRELVLEVADGGANTELSVSRVIFPIQLVQNTWYHIAAMVNGTRANQMMLTVDGVPYRGTDKIRHRFLTRLAGDLDAGVMSIPVEDASGFPPYGVVLVDDELIEYSSRSKSVLTVASGQGWNGRGARGTNLRNPSNTGGQRGVSHKSGAAVEVYGYSNPVQSDIPAGGARVVGGPWGALSVAYPLAPDRFPVSVGPGVTVLIEGIRDDATTLTIDTTVQGGGLTGFQSSGYALLVSREFGITGGPAGGFGGMEVISYTGRSGNALTGVRRGASLQRPDASTLNLQAKVHARFISGGGLPRLEVPCLILPISAAGSAAGDYHDPIETGFSERVQVDSEWLRYDEIVRGQGGPGAGVYFVRSDPDVYDEVLNRINTYKAMAAQGGGGQQMQQPPGPGPNTPPPQPPGGAEWDHATLRNQMAGEIEFRGQDGTLDSEVGVAHADGIDFIPVFRTEGYSAGPGDLVTVMTPDGSVREGRRVVWARRAETRMMPAALGVTDDAAYVGLNANVARRVVSTTRPIAQRRPGVHLPTAINFDTQGTARIIKAPSGEMPYTRDFNLVVGGTFGGVHAACWVDDVGTAALNTPQVWHRVDVPGTGDRFFPSDAKEIRLRRDSLWGGWGSEPALVRRRPANPGQPPGQGQPQNQVMTETGKVRAADRGRPAVTFSKREGEPWVRATLVQGRTFPNRPGQDDRDCGLIQMGAELIAYRGLEDRGAEGTMVLKDLIRGFMGTEAAPHYDGEEATFLTWMETALVKGGVDGASFNIPVENTFGFPQQGMGAFLDKIGHVTEIFSYTRTAQGEFQMPRGVDGQTQGERGIFRARYGTVAAAHEPGDLILRIPFRYWDRAAERTDDPNLGYYQFPIQVGESFFQSLTWSEKLPQSHLRLRLLARVDARASWGDEPSGSSGLYEFRKPQDESNANRIGMQGDSIEVRAYFEYEPGAFQPDFTSDSWKETPVLESVSMQYFAPNRVLSSVR